MDLGLATAAGEVVSLLLWLAGWGLLICIAGYVAYIVLAILWRASRLVLYHARKAAADIIHQASLGLALGVIWGVRWIVRKATAPILPMMERIKPVDPRLKMQELAALTNSLAGAKEILGLPPNYPFTKEDLSRQYRDVSKRINPHAGGTEGLQKAVNIARDILRDHAK